MTSEDVEVLCEMLNYKGVVPSAGSGGLPCGPMMEGCVQFTTDFNSSSCCLGMRGETVLAVLTDDEYSSLEVVQEGDCMLHERTTCQVVFDFSFFFDLIK